MSEPSESRTAGKGPCKRRYARFETCFTGVLHGAPDAEPRTCSVIDISLVGARLLTDDRLSDETPLVLEVNGGAKKTVRTAIHVRHSQLHGETGRYLSGIQLLPGTFEERKAIAEFVSFVFQGLSTG